ncbi:hypothetical protein E5D57_008404 [Metarhizium anisopliae]|nr:hypothetical protein E5D57_008404 [Metarhizium anisopliae]
MRGLAKAGMEMRAGQSGWRRLTVIATVKILRPQATSAATPMLVKVEDKLVQPDALVRRVLVSNGAAGLFPGGLVADKCDSRGVSGSHRE